jgi:hypothetical protein
LKSLNLERTIPDKTILKSLDLKRAIQDKAVLENSSLKRTIPDKVVLESSSLKSLSLQRKPEIEISYFNYLAKNELLSFFVFIFLYSKIRFVNCFFKRRY